MKSFVVAAAFVGAVMANTDVNAGCDHGCGGGQNPTPTPTTDINVSNSVKVDNSNTLNANLSNSNKNDVDVTNTNTANGGAGGKGGEGGSVNLAPGAIAPNASANIGPNAVNNNIRFDRAASTATAAGAGQGGINKCFKNKGGGGLGIQVLQAGVSANYTREQQWDTQCEGFERDLTVYSSGPIGQAVTTQKWLNEDPKLKGAFDAVVPLAVSNPYGTSGLGILMGIQPGATAQVRPMIINNTVSNSVPGVKTDIATQPPICKDGSLKGQPALYNEQTREFTCN